MSINLAIVELSTQIALLQAENERLQAELENKITNSAESNLKAINPRLKCWMQKLAKEKEGELKIKYSDRISAIQEMAPRWMPPKMIFDIKGRNITKRGV